MKKIKRECCILNFHGVRKNDNAVFNNRHMPSAEFEKMLVYLKKTYNIVSLSELFTIHHEKRKVSKKTVALTFDDGYANNFDIALPILKKHNIPATFYIISKCLVQDNYLAWPDVIDVVKKHHKQDITVNGYTFKYPGFYNEELKSELSLYLKTCGENTELLAYSILGHHDYHLREIKSSPELVLLISGKDISKYANEPLIEIGSHSNNHLNMEFLDAETTMFQLNESKNIIENKIGKKVSSFAFPDGSYTTKTIELAKKAGYDNVVAVEYRHNENNTNPDLLARFTISNSTTYESNALRLAKQFDFYGF